MPMGNVCPNASCGFAGKTKALSRDQSLPMPGKTTRVYQQTGLAGTACLELRTSYHRQTRTPNPLSALPLHKSFAQGAAVPSPAPPHAWSGPGEGCRSRPRATQLYADLGAAENRK